LNHCTTQDFERPAQRGIRIEENKMKRNLFDELKEGFTALESAHEGKITLRHHVVDSRSIRNGGLGSRFLSWIAAW
jgi:hypothetical protein